jgi:hypothetical protein
MVRDEARAIEVLEEFASAQNIYPDRHHRFYGRLANAVANEKEYKKEWSRLHRRHLAKYRRDKWREKVRRSIQRGVVPFKRGKVWRELLVEMGKAEEYGMVFQARASARVRPKWGTPYVIAVTLFRQKKKAA